MIRKILKILLYVVISALLFIGLLYLGQFLGWPRETALLLAGIAFAILLAVLAVRRFLHRRREKAYLYRHISEEMPSMPVEVNPKESLANIRKLRGSWEQGMDVLQNAIPLKDGDPLYAFPWYLIFGESGSGKSSAIASARLAGPVTSLGKAEEIVSTLNCEWQFTNNAVYLDTAGRYAVAENEEVDAEEWKTFLALLLKHRPQEPLNGVVLVLSVDSLQNDPEERLERAARHIRNRLNEAVNLLGVEFPVWLLITKMDHMAGFRDFAAGLPKTVLTQAMGQGFFVGGYKVSGTFSRAFDAVVKRLHELTASVLALEEADVDSFLALTVFQKEFIALKPRLLTFMNALCDESPYQAAVPLRGMYFSSARQKECVSVLDSFPELKQPGVPEEEGRLGIFLHELFDSFIPSDCGLWRPDAEGAAPERRILMYALCAWALLCVCFAGYLTYDFTRNRNALASFEDNGAKTFVLQRNRGEKGSLQSLDKYRQSIQSLSAQIGFLGIFSQATKLRDELRSDFCERMELFYRSRNLPSLFSGQMPPVGRNYQDFLFLIRRIALLEARLDGMTYDDLMSLPYGEHDFPRLPDMRSTQAAQQVKAVNMAWLSWTDSEVVRSEIQAARGVLFSLLSVTDTRDSGLDWIIHWANAQPEVPTLRPSTFFGMQPLPMQTDLSIDGAFTLAGRAKIESLFEILKTALDDDATFNRITSTFMTRYEDLYIQAWLHFARVLPTFILTAQGLTEDSSAASAMAGKKNACFAFLNRATTELQFTDSWEQKPGWLDLLSLLQMSRDIGGKATGEEKRALLDKLTGRFRKARTALSVASQLEGVTIDELDRTDKLYADYVDSLGQLQMAVGSPTGTLKIMGDYFQSLPPASGVPSLSATYAAFAKLQSHCVATDASADVVWRLLELPTVFLDTYFLKASAREIQARWEADVRSQVEYMPEQKVRSALFGNDQGLVNQFISSTLSPFITRTAGGYRARERGNRWFPFTQEFLGFLNNASVWEQVRLPSYHIKLSGLPTSVNADAYLKPYATYLSVQCSNGVHTLRNLNYPVSLDFDWSPETCSNVTLSIFIDKMELKRTYNGPLGLVSFFQEFSRGFRNFTPDHFRSYKKELQAAGIKTLQVGFKSEGAENIMKLTRQPTLFIPEIIVQ